MDIARTLLDLSALTGVAGHESEAAEAVAGLLERHGPVTRTPLGSVLCTVRAPGGGEPHLLLDAHIDEIGMIVTYIGEKGFLRVAPVGGIDRRLLLASAVTVHAAGGGLPGVICSIPPHLSGDEDKKNKKVEEIHIDVGMDREAAQKAIRPGDRVTINSAGRSLLGDLVSGKAIDDRAGCVAILCALEALEADKLQCGLTVLFSSMEETGGVGAKTAAYSVAPTHAIAVDVGFGHTPDAPRERCGELKKGPMIGFAPVLDRALSRELASLADAGGIPWQPDVMGGRTGTNADAIAVIRGGVVTGLLSIPQRYMHTPIETVSVQDVRNTGLLLAAYAGSLEGGGRHGAI